MHGEQGALICTAKIVETVPWIDAKYYASTQVMDEARHVEVFAKYLDTKLSGHYPINAHLKMLLDDIVNDSRWDMTYLGMQIMVEGLALAAFGFMHQMTTEPLLKQLLRYVMSDEARHVAFGVLSLKEYYEELTDAEILERQEFAFEAAVRMRDRFLQQEVWERMGVPVKEAVQLVMQTPSPPDVPEDAVLQDRAELQEARPARPQRRLAAPPVRGARRHPVRGLGRHRRGVRGVRPHRRRLSPHPERRARVGSFQGATRPPSRLGSDVRRVRGFGAARCCGCKAFAPSGVHRGSSRPRPRPSSRPRWTCSRAAGWVQLRERTGGGLEPHRRRVGGHGEQLLRAEVRRRRCARPASRPATAGSWRSTASCWPCAPTGRPCRSTAQLVPNDHTDAGSRRRGARPSRRAARRRSVPVLRRAGRHAPTGSSGTWSDWRGPTSTSLRDEPTGSRSRPIDSYHTVWFELHEDLLATLGRERSTEPVPEYVPTTARSPERPNHPERPDHPERSDE